MSSLQPPNDPIPTTQSLTDVWSDGTTAAIPPETLSRWRTLIQTFATTYAHPPTYVARSPGRVNIIGEHIDYSFYDVLPAALSVDVLVAITARPAADRTASSTIRLANTNGARFPPDEFVVAADRDIDIDASTHGWGNYFKAGLRVALLFLKEKQGGSYVPADLDVVLDGNVPPGGGVSSSAAFICACALAVIKAHGYDMTKQDLHSTSIVAERAVGVFSGGMDQAASIFSRRDYLLYTSFHPSFQCQHVPIPSTTTPEADFTFLVAQSFITSNKAETGPRHYNLRVAECTLATVVLAKLNAVELQRDSTSLGYCFRTFHEALVDKEGRRAESLEKQLDRMIELTTQQLTQEEGYTRAEMADILGMTVAQLEAKFLSSFPVEAERFMLRQRALHCFQEARRVLDFKARLTSSSSPDGSSQLTPADVAYLGNLLNASQSSCRDLYNCSCPEVNSICEIARGAGALGSRVTGAGWGGATVHMVPVAKIGDVVGALRREYYLKRFPGIEKDKLEEAIIVSKPSNGSFLIYGKAITEALE